MKSLLNSIYTLLNLFFVNTVFGNEVPEDIIADPAKAVKPVMTEKRKQFLKNRAAQNGEIFDDSIKTVEQEFKEKQLEASKQEEGKTAEQIAEETRLAEEAAAKATDTTGKTDEVIDDDAPVLVGDKEFSQEDFAAVIEDAKKHYGEEEFDGLSEKMKEKAILDRLNLKEGSKALNKKNMEAANQRKAAEKEIADKEAQLSETQVEIQEQMAELEARENKIIDEYTEKENRLKEIEKELTKAQKLADKVINTDDLTVDEIFDEKQNKRDAQKEVERLLAEEKQSKQRLIDLATENNGIWKTGLMKNLQFHFPDELSTDTAPEVVIGKFYQGVEKLDKAIVRRLSKVADDYMNLTPAERKGLTIQDFYEQVKYNFAPIAREPKKETKTSGKPENINVSEALKKFLKRQDGVPDPKGGKGGGHATVQTPETGAQKDRVTFKKNFENRMQKA